jgi:transcriptional regulator with XRE-family HTH domain
VDGIADVLLQRIRALLAARPDVSRRDFARAIGRPTPSWISEFFAGKRTTNDFRLVVRMARFFGVPVGYLLNEADREMDAATASLLGAWRDLREPNRNAVLQLALHLRSQQGGPAPLGPPDGLTAPTARTAAAATAPRKRIRR